MKLADGISADDIVIVHKIHDGEEYEIIKIESYDAKTNTITFKTKSFSNYAIATKTASKTEEVTDKTNKLEKTTTDSTNTEERSKIADNLNVPKTGDNAIITIAVFVIAMLGLAITFKINKKIKQKNNNI